MSDTLSRPELSPATRVGSNPDLLRLLTALLDKSSLLDCLLSSARLYLAAVPHLYHTLDVKRDQKLFVGARESTDGTILPFSKNAALRHVKVINLFEHEIDACPGRSVPVLERLEVLHPAGGGRPAGFKSSFCASKTCPFIARACRLARTVVLRHFGEFGSALQVQLPNLPKVERIVLKIRPCQLPVPDYTGSGRSDGGYGSS